MATKTILDDFKKSLNGSFANENKILAAIIGDNGALFWSQIYSEAFKRIPIDYLNERIVDVLGDQKEITIEFFGNRHNNSGNTQLEPIVLPFNSFGKLLIVEIGPNSYFAVLCNANADMKRVGPAMIKTANELSEVLHPVKAKK